MKLGVNVDHVATLRQSRGTLYPDPVVAALIAEHAGCDSIVVHLREDRRHIQERDVFLIKEIIKIPLNLEMSTNREIVAFAATLLPQQATLVPERRQELTTEGGINLIENHSKVGAVIKKLKRAGVKVSLFIDPVKKQLRMAKQLGADIVEFNTGRFSEAKTHHKIVREIKALQEAVRLAQSLGFSVAAGHGIDYENIKTLLRIQGIAELNIGHAIICRSVFIGILAAVEEMLALIKKYRVEVTA